MASLKYLLSALLLTILVISFSSCDEDVEGCTDPTADNYNPDATIDNGSCTYNNGGETFDVTRNGTTVTIAGETEVDFTFYSDSTYILSGFVFVDSGAVLTIQPGTVIKGERATKGSLIIRRGGKIMADGGVNNPIIFTSDQPAGQRSPGDWGGIIVCGFAPVNLSGGQGVVEGGTGALFGGSDPNDNSGIIRYVRIEFAGIAFQPNQEINGLTMAAVGDSTVVDYVQVSFGGDDSFEWFGGNVNAKHLVAFLGLDDDFDTDNGYSGKLQYLVSLRDPDRADVSGSNGMESDNDASGSDDTPFTTAVFSNVSLFGPAATPSTPIDINYQNGIHFRRNTSISVFNTVIAGYRNGMFIQGSGAEDNATNNDLRAKNCIIAGSRDEDLKDDAFTPFDPVAWYTTNGFNNVIYGSNDSLKVNDPFNLANPDFLPSAGSPLLTGADFSDNKLQDSFFDVVTFRGAFGTTNWMTGWTNFDPQNTVY